MSKLAHFTLQQALYTLLSEDSEILSIVTEVYENPSPVIAYPYLVFGSLTALDWSTKTTSGLQTVVPIHAYSQTSKKEVIEIINRVYDLLLSGPLTLDGHDLVAMRFEFSEITLENDGVTYHGVIRFRAYTEAVAA
jgi:hypothetical protein